MIIKTELRIRNNDTVSQKKNIMTERTLSPLYHLTEQAQQEEKGEILWYILWN